MSTDERPTAAAPAGKSLGRRLWSGARIAVTGIVVLMLGLGLWEQVKAGAPLSDVASVVAVGTVLTAVVWWAFPLLALVAAIFLGDD